MDLFGLVLAALLSLVYLSGFVTAWLYCRYNAPEPPKRIAGFDDQGYEPEPLVWGVMWQAKR